MSRNPGHPLTGVVVAQWLRLFICACYTCY